MRSRIARHALLCSALLGFLLAGGGAARGDAPSVRADAPASHTATVFGQNFCFEPMPEGAHCDLVFHATNTPPIESQQNSLRRLFAMVRTLAQHATQAHSTKTPPPPK